MIVFMVVILFNCMYKVIPNRLLYGVSIGFIVGITVPVISTIIWHLPLIDLPPTTDLSKIEEYSNAASSWSVFAFIGSVGGFLMIPFNTILSSVFASALAGAAQQK